MDTQISDYVLPFVIRDIFGNEYGQFEKNKEKFWGLFYFYKEKRLYKKTCKFIYEKFDEDEFS